MSTTQNTPATSPGTDGPQPDPGSALAGFTAATRAWFTKTFAAPTPVQAAAWQAIAGGGHALVIAPTGSGKTLAAFLKAIDGLFAAREAETPRAGTGSGNGLSGPASPQDASGSDASASDVSRPASGHEAGSEPAGPASPQDASAADASGNPGSGLGGRLEAGRKPAPRRTTVLYVSPLKALGADVRRNLDVPLLGVEAERARRGEPEARLTVGLRTGDTPAPERAALVRNPPDILITTPESLYLMLTSRAREALRGVRTVIVDEVHAVAGTKRGAHLALSLERLDALLPAPAQRIGLSATVRPVERVAAFLGGGAPVRVVQPPAGRRLDLRIVVPVEDLRDLSAPPAGTPAGKARSGSIWYHVEASVLDRVLACRSTIVFVNSRGLCERLTARLNELYAERCEVEADGDRPDARNPDPLDPSPLDPSPLDPDAVSRPHADTGRHRDAAVFLDPDAPSLPESDPLSRPQAEAVSWENEGTAFLSTNGPTSRRTDGMPPVIARSHHGSVSKERRAAIEEDLKSGRLRCVVATSSLELGIDMGQVDQVIQVAPPPSVAAGLQRVGRAGHRVGGTPAGRIYPRTRRDLVDAAVTAERMLAGRIEAVNPPRNPLDVLAQHTVAAVAMDSWDANGWFELVRRADPFRDLSRPVFDRVLDMLAGRFPSEAFAEFRPRLVWDRSTGRLDPRPGAQRLAVVNGGTIPDRGTYSVVLPEGEGPDAERAGSRRVGELDEEMVFESRVNDVITLGATSWRIRQITADQVVVSPAPGTSARLPFWHGDGPGRPAELGEAVGAFIREVAAGGPEAARPRLLAAGLDDRAVTNLGLYLRDQQEATGALPTDRLLVVERCRDELGDWRVMLHSPYGRRVHAPWALAVAERLRERYGIDGAVIASDDGIVARVPETEGPLPGAGLFVFSPDTLSGRIAGAVGGSALFASRFRECASRALLLPRRSPGRRSPLWQQRLRAGQLLEVAREFLDFPILLETARECLQDVYDLPALTRLMERIRDGGVSLADAVTATPSPFAANLLFGYVGAFMYDDDIPLAERRASLLALDSALLADLLGEADPAALLDPAVCAAVEAELQRLTPDRQVRGLEGVADLLRELGPLSLPGIAARLRPETGDRLPDDVRQPNGGVRGRAETAALTHDPARSFQTVQTGHTGHTGQTGQTGQAGSRQGGLPEPLPADHSMTGHGQADGVRLPNGGVRGDSIPPAAGGIPLSAGGPSPSADGLSHTGAVADPATLADEYLGDLERAGRAMRVRVAGEERWAAVEDAARLRDGLGTRLPPGLPGAFLEPVPDPLGDLIARFARTHGPFSTAQAAAWLGLGPATAGEVLDRLAARSPERGRVLRGRFGVGARAAFPDPGSNPSPDAGSNPSADAGSNPSPDAGSNPSPDAGSNPGADAGSNDGSQAGATAEPLPPPDRGGGASAQTACPVPAGDSREWVWEGVFRRLRARFLQAAREASRPVDPSAYVRLILERQHLTGEAPSWPGSGLPPVGGPSAGQVAGQDAGPQVTRRSGPNAMHGLDQDAPGGPGRIGVQPGWPSPDGFSPDTFSSGGFSPDGSGGSQRPPWPAALPSGPIGAVGPSGPGGPQANPGPALQGEDGVLRVVEQLSGLALPAALWESRILPLRVRDYAPGLLDALIGAGEILWSGAARTGERDGQVALHLRELAPETLAVARLGREPERPGRHRSGPVTGQAETETDGGPLHKAGAGQATGQFGQPRAGQIQAGPNLGGPNQAGQIQEGLGQTGLAGGRLTSQAGEQDRPEARAGQAGQAGRAGSQAAGKTAELASELASKPAPELASELAGGLASERIPELAEGRASKPASKPAAELAPELASERAAPGQNGPTRDSGALARDPHNPADATLTPLQRAILRVLADGGAYFAAQLAALAAQVLEADRGRTGTGGWDGPDPNGPDPGGPGSCGPGSRGPDSGEFCPDEAAQAGRFTPPEPGSARSAPPFAPAGPPAVSPPDLHAALWGLVWDGRITTDSLAALRAWIAGAGPLSGSGPAGLAATRPSASRNRSLRRRGRVPRTALADAPGHHRAASPAFSLTAPSLAGRWALLPQEDVPAPVLALSVAEGLLDRYGVVTRGAVIAERLPGGFPALQRLFRGLEDAGRVLRGRFVDRQGAAQFAESRTVDRLRELAGPELPGPGRDQARSPAAAGQLVALSAADPANPFGALLPWPRHPSKTRPSRRPGAWVILADGRLILWLAQGGRQLLTFTDPADPDTPDRLRDAALALAAGLRRCGSGVFTVETVDDRPIRGLPARDRGRERAAGATAKRGTEPSGRGPDQAQDPVSAGGAGRGRDQRDEKTTMAQCMSFQSEFKTNIQKKSHLDTYEHQPIPDSRPDTGLQAAGPQPVIRSGQPSGTPGQTSGQTSGQTGGARPDTGQGTQAEPPGAPGSPGRADQAGPRAPERPRAGRGPEQNLDPVLNPNRIAGPEPDRAGYQDQDGDPHGDQHEDPGRVLHQALLAAGFSETPKGPCWYGRHGSG